MLSLRGRGASARTCAEFARPVGLCSCPGPPARPNLNSETWLPVSLTVLTHYPSAPPPVPRFASTLTPTPTPRQVAFDGAAPGTRYPGDNCPVVWGKCAHAFHLPCITRWLQNNQTCPICRRDWEFASEAHPQGGGGAHQEAAAVPAAGGACRIWSRGRRESVRIMGIMGMGSMGMGSMGMGSMGMGI